MDSRFKKRSRIILSLTLIIAFCLCVVLYQIQIVKGEDYSKKADSQYVRPSQDFFDRGIIYFTSKEGTKIQAATQKNGYRVFINPREIEDPKMTYEALREYLDIKEDEFISKASKENDSYEELADKVSEEKALFIKNFNIKGVGISKQVWRIYPAGSIASHTLGILGENASSSDISGKYGLERYYEDVLKRPGQSSSVNIFAELFADIKGTVFSNNKQGDIVTTIEPSVQKYLGKVLEGIFDTWKPESVGGIIIDPLTGEIIAMSSLPDFDPNDISKIKDIHILSNRLVENAYEMGSILKPLTMATALDVGAFTPESKYEDTGTMILNGKKISNHDGVARGQTSMQSILAQSLNIGAATLALEVGKEEFSKYFFNFGLGSKTGIDLPNESSGIVGNLRSGRDVEIATAAFGQGIAISPISITRALSFLANGGYKIRPHLVREIQYTDGSTDKIDLVREGPYLKKQTVDDVTSMLVKVVDESLLKGAIKMDRYSIAAKTGTAQIPDLTKGGYYSDRYLHSFFGYFPAYEPKFLIFLYQVYPKGTEYASATLTEPFDQLVKYLINYYNIPPDRNI